MCSLTGLSLHSIAEGFRTDAAALQELARSDSQTAVPVVWHSPSHWYNWAPRPGCNAPSCNLECSRPACLVCLHVLSGPCAHTAMTALMASSPCGPQAGWDTRVRLHAAVVISSSDPHGAPTRDGGVAHCRFWRLAAYKYMSGNAAAGVHVSCDSIRKSGSCDGGYSCTYQYNISWASSSLPVAPETNLRLVFERLFGVGSPAERAKNFRRRQET